MFLDIKKTNTHKIITILGLKLKFKLSKSASINNVSTNSTNKIIIHKTNAVTIENKQIPGLNIEFLSQNSIVEVYEPFNFSNCNIVIGDNSKVIIQSSIYPISNLSICLNSKDSSVSIGKNCSINGAIIEMNRVVNIHSSIGDNCMISADVLLRAHDSHCIYDIDSKEILNLPKKGIIIGDNVWVGQYVKILKDVKIPNNSIIGLGSVVVKSFNEENIALGGVPAKIIKRRVNWHRYNEYMYQERLEEGLEPYNDYNQELIKQELEKRFIK